MVRYVLVVILLLGFKAEAQSSALAIGDSLLVRGNYTKAIEAYLKHKNPKQVNTKIAKAFIALGNYDKAIEYYEQQLELVPKDELVMLDYAKLLSKIKKYEQASEVLHQLIDIDYKNPNYHYETGLVLERLKDSTAQNRFYSAYQLDPTHQKAIFKMAKRHLIKRNYDQVDYYADKGLASYANNKELISLKAQNCFWKEDYKNAVKWFEKLLELNESTLFVHEKLSLCYSKLYEYEKAIEHCKVALKLEPNNATNLYVLGKLYERNDDYENAEKYILAAITLSDIALDSEYMQLGYVYNLQGKHKEAITAYTRATKENPENEDAHFFVVLTKDRYYKDIDTRLKLYEDYKKKFPKSRLIVMVDKRISELKEEKFLKTD
jgi:tetratricopeptide (TPR) repeat protein